MDEPKHRYKKLLKIDNFSVVSYSEIIVLKHRIKHPFNTEALFIRMNHQGHGDIKI